MGRSSATKRKQQPKKEEEEKFLFDDDSDFEPTVKPAKKTAKKQKKDTAKSESSKKKKPTKKSKKQKEEESDQEVDTTPLVIKKDTIMNRALVAIGAHTSIQGGIHEAAIQANSVGARSFGLFVGNQRTWNQKALTEDSVKSFKETCKKLNYPPHLILPHGSYLINLGSAAGEKLDKSRGAFVAEMQRCEELGLVLYNFHPGSHLKEITEDECLDTIAESINYGHKHTKNIIAVLENTAGQGSNVGYKFEHLKKIIEKVENKDRVGVCFDTCHAFGAGYDLRTKEKCDEVFKQFDEIVGFKYLKGMHLNDSKKGLNSKLDRHCNIGKGEIGLECFKYILNDKRFNNIPLILETEGPWDKEIQLLESLID